jgi:hypothetical protein
LSTADWRMEIWEACCGLVYVATPRCCCSCRERTDKVVRGMRWCSERARARDGEAIESLHALQRDQQFTWLGGRGLLEQRRKVLIRSCVKRRPRQTDIEPRSPRW